MRVLVTNDDGVASAGLPALAGALVDAGFDVVVVAPVHDMSGSSAALGHLSVDDELEVVPTVFDDRPDLTAFALDGPPALAVMAARLGAFGELPDLIVSGINPGCNTGRAVLHSGTVGAALTAANLGVSGVAVSLDGAAPRHWATAASLAVEATHWVAGAPLRTVVNLNVPDCSLSALRGVRWGQPAPFGTVRAALVETSEHRLRMELQPTSVDLPPDSDTALVAAGYASVALLGGVALAEWQPVADHLERATLRRTA